MAEKSVLLVPLNDRHEPSLFLLATRPDLAIKGIKTIGLQIVVNRLIKLLGDLPVVKDRRERMVDVRNGAVHIGTGDESRYVLLDCLAIVGVLLERLGIEPQNFFGPHVGSVDALLDERKTEVSRQVAVKMAKARARLRSVLAGWGVRRSKSPIRRLRSAQDSAVRRHVQT